MAIKAPRVRVTTYIRNVGRSFGYSIGDVAAQYNPTLKSIIDDTKSAVDDASYSIGELKTSIRNTINEYKTGVVANTLDDLKTGKWYNKEREEQAFNDMFGGFDFDDDDDDWGDWDSDSDEDSDFSDSSDDTRDTKAIINSIDSVGENISKNVAYSNARSAEYIVSNQKASSRAMYELAGKGFNQVSGILLNMSHTMGGLASLGEPLSQHIQNSGVFYTKTTESLEKITTSLDKLVERTAYMDDMNKKTSSSSKKKSLGDIAVGGDFSLSSYIDMVKENTKDQLEMVTGFKEIFEMMGGKGGKNFSFASKIPEFIIKKVTPNFFKATMKQLNETINNALINGMVRGKKAADNSSSFLLNMLSDILFPDFKLKKSINTGKYNKGPMQWDGEAKMALTRVIPDYLAKILGALTGEEARYFDYSKGKTTTIGAINKSRTEFIQDRANSAGRDLKNEILKNTSDEKLDDVSKLFDKFMATSIMSGEFSIADLRNMSKESAKKVLDSLGVKGNNQKALIDALFNVVNGARDGKFGNRQRNLLSNFEKNFYSAQIDISNEFANQEANNGLQRLLYDEDFYNKGGQIIITGGGRGRGRRGRDSNTNTGSNRIVDIERYDERKVSYTPEEVANSEETENGKTTKKYKVGGRILRLDDKELKNLIKELEKRSSKEDKDDFLKSEEGKQIVKTAKDSFSGMIHGFFSGNNDDDDETDQNPSAFKRLTRGIKHIWEKPFYAVSLALNNLSNGINELFWGKNGVKERLEETWNNLKEKAKNIWDSIFPAEEGEEKKTFRQAMSEEWGNIKKGLKRRFLGDKYSNLSEARAAFNAEYLANERDRDRFGREEGGQGSGLIHKLPSHRLSSAFKRGKKFKPTMYSGGASTLIGKNNKGQEIYQDDNGNYKIMGKDGELHDMDIKNATGNRRNRIAAGIDEAYLNSMKDAVLDSEPVKNVKEGASILGHGLYDFISKSIMGDDADPEKMEATKKNIFDSLSKTMGDLAGAKGAMGIGAIGGVGVSLLTGALVGPIAGAAIGAGVGLATKSEAFQKFLFGGETIDDETGEKKYTEGLLGGFGKALKDHGFKDIKSIGMGAGIGATAGLFMGSPILGALFGSAAGFVATNEKAKKAVFGDFEEDDPKTIRGKIVKTIKERKGTIAAGAIAGLIAGPFGLVGNLILGSGLGMLSTTEDFKNFMFGNKEKGIEGLTTKIHDRIVNPLDDIMHNLAYAIQGGIKNLFDNLDIVAKGMFEKTKGLVAKLVEKHPLLDKLARGVTSTAKKVVTAPVEIAGSLLGRIDRSTSKFNLKKGYNVYNRDKRRAATAQERLLTRGKLSNKTLDVQEDENGNKTYYQIDPFTGKRKKIREGKYNRLAKKAENDDINAYGINSKYGNLDKIMAGLSDADVNEMFNDDTKMNNFITQQLGEGAKKADIANIKNLFKDEYKGRGLENKQDKALDATIKTVDYLQQIRDFIIFGKTPKADDAPKTEGGRIVKRTGKDGVDRYYREDENGKLGKQMKTAEGALLYQQQEEMNVPTPTGDVIRYKEGQDGDMQPDVADKGTKNALDKMDKFNNAIFQIPVIGGALKGIHSGLTRFGKFLFGDEEEDGSKGLLGGIFGAVGGAASGLIKLITGKDIDFSVLGKGIKSGLSKLVTKDGLLFAAENFLGPALLAFAFSGKFDKMASKLTGDAYNEESAMRDSNISVTTEDGQVIDGVHKEGKNFVDANGNIIKNVASVNSVEKGRASLSDKLKYNTGRGLATGTSSATTAVLKRTGLGKALVKNGAGIADDVAQKALRTNVITTVRDVCAKLAKLPILKNLNIDFDGLANSLSKKISQALTGNAAKTAMKVASGAVAVFRIAFIGVDFSTGYQDARSTLGITDEPTTGQRIVSGLIRVIKNCIPIVGTLIPDEMLVDLFCDYVAPALGIDVEELKGQRQKAQEEVDAYNAEHGTDYSVSDYNKKVLGDYTWTEKIGNKATEMWENFKLGASTIGEGIGKAIDKVKDTTNIFKQALDSGIQKIYEGDIEGYWDVSELDDPENPMGGFNTAIAKVGRFAAFPVVAFKWVGYKIKESISGMVDSVKEDFSSLKDAMGTQIEAGSTADIKTILQYATWVPPKMLSDPLGGVFMGIHGITYPFTVTLGAFKGIGSKIKEAIGPLVDDFKTEASSFSTAMDAMNEAAKNKDLKGIWTAGYTKSTDSVAGSIFSGLHFVMKFIKTIGMMVNTVAEPFKEPVANAVGGLVEGAKGLAGKVGSSIFNMFHGMADEAALGAGSSGFVSQFDPRYQNLRVSGSSFAGKGCGPAVASMVASSLGKNLPVSSAVSASRGYQAGNGVTLDYFQRALGSQGIDTEYIAGGGAGDLYNSIASGKKVVLLGQDRMNDSKANSPFGPNNHYVVATGLDRSGNVVVNDPELNGPAVYSPGILNSVKYGVAAGRSGIRRSRGLRRLRRFAGGASSQQVAEQVWAFFISKGFSEIATACIMGNLQAESGMDPTAIQGKNNTGPAAGIAQWENYKTKEGRWLALKTFADKLGVDWTNLDAQLNYLLSELQTKDMDKRMQGLVGESNFPKAGLSKSQGMSFEYFKTQNKDIDRGTRIFEAAFERASVQAMDKRINAAKDFYTKFSGKDYTYNSTINNTTAQEALASLDTSMESSTGETTTENNGPKSIFEVLGSITSAFTNAFSGAFNKEEESSSTYSENPDGTNTGGENVNDTVSNTATGPRIGEKITQIKGGKAQPHPQGKNNAASVVDIARSQLGVTEEGDNITDYGKFTGADKAPWCASFASWVFDKAFNGNKEARNKALRGGTSASVSTFLNNFKKAGAMKDTPQPGDLVIYKNGTSHVGIVEDVQGNQVYTIEGNTSGDNGFDRNGGVVYRKSFDYTNRSSGKGKKLTGFGRPDWSYSDMANAAGGSSGVLMRSRAGSSSSRPAFVDPSTGRIVPFTRFAGGATNIADASRNMLSQIATSASSNNNRGGISPELIGQLLSAITSVLNTIANNTAPVDKIYQALTAYLESGGDSGINKNGNTTININRSPEKAAAGAEGEIDSNIKSLVATLADLAKG